MPGTPDSSSVDYKHKADSSAQQSLLNCSKSPWLSKMHAGVDEVGLGPLAGPVAAAAVLLDPSRPVAELNDSKKLSARKREVLAEQIRERALGWALGWASVDEVDRLNVLRASHLAMQRAVEQLLPKPRMVWVDGNKTPMLPMPCAAVVQGDKLVPQISAASILAKVARDEYMVALDDLFPGYGFARHKGYPTRQHMEVLNDLGITPHHRTSFAPVRRLMKDHCRPA